MGALIHFLSKSAIIELSTFAFALGEYIRGKMAKKVWVLALIPLKGMGAEAPTAPILSGTLLFLTKNLCSSHEK